MPVSVVPSLGSLLDGLSVGPAGGRTQVFRSVPFGRHLNQDTWAALASNDSILAVRGIANPTAVSDIGSGAAQNQEFSDVYAWWQDGDDLTDPAAYLKAVVDAITAKVRTAEKVLGASWYAQVVNAVDTTDLLKVGLSAAVRYSVVVTVKANAVDVY